MTGAWRQAAAVLFSLAGASAALAQAGAASAPVAAASAVPASAPAWPSPPAAAAVVGDAMPASLTGVPGDAARGRAIVVDRRVGLCLLCHTGPFPEERFQGSLAPDLAGAGARWSVGQLRLRVADARRLNPETLMPSYARTEGLARVGAPWQGKPVLSAQQIEDVVAFLATLR